MIISQTGAELPLVPTRPVVYCIVPPDLASRVWEALAEYFAHDPGVEVIVERRSGDARRRQDHGPPEGIERRVAERRCARAAVTAASESWPLPPAARGHADRLALVLCDVPILGRDNVRMERLLIERVRGGDGAAAELLYARHFAGVQAWAIEAVGPRRADAVTQSVFDEALAQV